MKHISVKVLCGIMAMVLLTTCVIGTTLARYTTEDSAGDTALLAKWGIELAVGGTLFGKDYAANNALENADEIVAATSQSVSASANVVAPGTKNESGLQVKISGTPEVAYTVAVSGYSNNEDIYLAVGEYGMMVEVYGLNAASNVIGYYTTDANGNYEPVISGAWDSSKTYYSLEDAVVLTDAYYPVAWDVNGTDYANVTAATEAIVNGLTASKNAGDDAAAQYTITWAWAIDGNDEADTILGNLIAGNTNIVAKSGGTKYYAVSVSDNKATANGVTYANLDVSFDITVNVTQQD